MKRFAFAIAIALFSLSSCTTSDAPTQATPGTDNTPSKTISGKYHDAGVFLNECCGEDVAYEVDAHFTIKDETDEQGVRTWRLYQNSAQFVLTGKTTGLKYMASQLDKWEEISQPGGCPKTSTLIERFRATATGSGQGKNDCSFTIAMTIQWALDADCNVTLDIVSVETECE